MKKKLARDISPTLFQYCVLLIVLTFGLWAFLTVSFDRVLQFQVIAALSVFYFLWSVFFHLQRRDLTFIIVAEYFFFALLAATIGYIILIR